MPTKYQLNFKNKKQGNLEKIAGGSTSGANDVSIIPKHKMKYQKPDQSASLESDVEEEVSETLKQFRESVQKENALRDDNIDPNFYSVIVFNNSRQRQAFFRALKVKCTDRTNLKFINGVKLAEVLGIALPESSSNEAGKFKVNRELLSFCHNPKQQ